MWPPIALDIDDYASDVFSLRGNSLRVDGLRALDAAVGSNASLNSVKVDKRYLRKVGSHSNMKVQYL